MYISIGHDGVTSGTNVFTSNMARFKTNMVVPGDYLIIYNGPDLGSYRILTVDDELTITVEKTDNFNAFEPNHNVEFEVLKSYTLNNTVADSTQTDAKMQDVLTTVDSLKKELSDIKNILVFLRKLQMNNTSLSEEGTMTIFDDDAKSPLVQYELYDRYGSLNHEDVFYKELKK